MFHGSSAAWSENSELWSRSSYPPSTRGFRPVVACGRRRQGRHLFSTDAQCTEPDSSERPEPIGCPTGQAGRLTRQASLSCHEHVMPSAPSGCCVVRVDAIHPGPTMSPCPSRAHVSPPCGPHLPPVPRRDHADLRIPLFGLRPPRRGPAETRRCSPGRVPSLSCCPDDGQGTLSVSVPPQGGRLVQRPLFVVVDDRQQLGGRLWQQHGCPCSI